MITYMRSPLRSMYNQQDASSAANRAMMSRFQRQLGGLAQTRQQPAMDTGMTDAEETAAKRMAGKKALQYGYDYLKTSGGDTVVPTESWNTATPTESYIDAGSMDGGLSAANTPTGSEAYIDAGGMGQGADTSSGTSSDASSGSYLGALTGALAGYSTALKTNDPVMTNPEYEDGFGRYDTSGFNYGRKDQYGNTHYDVRDLWGGASGGGYIGWKGAAPLSSAAVRWSHPYMQDMTRDVIMFGDKLGGSAGAMALDPIGTVASGKYERKEIAKSGLEAGLSGGLSLVAHSDPVKKLGKKLKKLFG